MKEDNYILKEKSLDTTTIHKKNKVKKRFFAEKQWYKLTLTIILWSVLQEVIMASTDLVDNIFVNHLRPEHINGFQELLNYIKDSGWKELSTNPDFLKLLEQNGLLGYAGDGMFYEAGQIGVNAVSASNQLYIIMFCMVSGFCYGAGIFSAQYFGAGEYQKLKQVTALKMYLTLSITVLFMLFAIPGITEKMIGFTTHPLNVSKPTDQLVADKESIMSYFSYFQNEAAKLATQEGVRYYRIVSMSYILLTINQVTVTVLRETRRPFYSLFMASISLVANSTCNIFLTSPTFIPGFIGFGVEGSAYGTVASRIMQTIFIFCLLSIKRFEFIPRIKHFLINRIIVKLVLLKSIPILFNETLYAFAQVLQVKLRALYSVESLTANAMYETMLMAFFSPMYHGLNAGISTLVGNELGAQRFDKAKYNATHLMRLSFVIGICFTALLSGLSFVIPNLIFPNALPEANRIGIWMIFIYTMTYPVIMINNCCYSVLRAGGSVISSFLMDSGFNWTIQIPTLAFLILANKHIFPESGLFTLDIVWVHLITCLCETFKLIPALILYFKKTWVRSLIEPKEEDPTYILTADGKSKIDDLKEVKSTN